MKTDAYTKTILTIIAVCLTINVVKDFEMFPKIHAAEGVSEKPPKTEYALVPISETNTMDVRIVDINTYDELNVNLKNIDTYDEMKVEVSKISTSDELDVNIDELGGGFVSHGGPLRVTTD